MSDATPIAVTADGADDGAGPKRDGRGGADLVAELTRTLELLPGDQVTCVRVYGDFYRCNWWSPGDQTDAGAMIEGLRASTYRIRMSRFLHVTTVEGRVVVRDATATATAVD